MDFQQLISLVVVLVALAALRSVSVLLVIARWTANGFRHGVAIGSGIVCADLPFTALALVGTSVVADVDLGHATIGQFAAVLLLTAIAVGFPKLACAKLAPSAVLFSSFSRYRVRIRQAAGIGVLGTGALVIVKAP